MTDVASPYRSHLRLVRDEAPSGEDFLPMLRRLTPVRRRILEAVIAKVLDVDDDDGEAEACAMIDQVIAILRAG